MAGIVEPKSLQCVKYVNEVQKKLEDSTHTARNIEGKMRS